MKSGVDEEWKTQRKVACANFLKIDPKHIVRIQMSFEENAPELEVLVHIPLPGGSVFNFVTEHFVPFRRGQKVRPYATPLHPRFGKSLKDALLDNRKRTVEKMDFDEKTHIWWVWLKGKQHPFNSRLLSSAES